MLHQIRFSFRLSATYQVKALICFLMSRIEAKIHTESRRTHE